MHLPPCTLHPPPCVLDHCQSDIVHPCAALCTPAQLCTALRSPVQPCAALCSHAQPCAALCRLVQPCASLCSPVQLCAALWPHPCAARLERKEKGQPRPEAPRNSQRLPEVPPHGPESPNHNVETRYARARSHGGRLDAPRASPLARRAPGGAPCEPARAACAWAPASRREPQGRLRT